MITKWIINSDYIHKNNRDVYMTVLKIEEYEDYHTLYVVWKLKHNSRPLTDRHNKICVLNNAMKQWNPWLK